METTNLKYFAFVTLLSLANLAFGQKPLSLVFNAKNFSPQELTLNGKTIKVRAYENIIYVQNPVDTAYQKLNIYVPEAYYQGQSINGYTAATAPVFFPNNVGGYMPAQPAKARGNAPSGAMPAPPGGAPGQMPAAPARPTRPNTVLEALAHGYVVASAGARGRSLKDTSGKFTGKAPAGIVDLKAAVRYLKFNDKKMPGDARKIISNGTSAGGAMSTLLGATGDHPDYEPYLKALGAAKATDHIFAVSAYCPIINLGNSDAAYEWQFEGIHTYKRGGPMQSNPPPASSLSAEQIAVAQQLKVLFPAYVNGLKLKDKSGTLLSLDKDGNGNFKELIKSYLTASAQKELDKGTDLSSFAFLSISNGKVNALDYNAYIKYIERMKTPPAFDALDMTSPENNLFGTATVPNLHFTSFAQEQSKATSPLADPLLVKMMNPMHYIGAPQSATSKHWRIRHGAKDKDTSFAIPVMLATLLENKGYAVSLELPWEKPHSGDYDLNELFAWIDGICAKGGK